jgi:hypothetical protein
LASPVVVAPERDPPPDAPRPRAYRGAVTADRHQTPGLCGRCRNARLVVSGRGSRFILCELSRADPRFPRYPSLPVIACAGFTPGGSGDASGALDAPEGGA